MILALRIKCGPTVERKKGDKKVWPIFTSVPGNAAWEKEKKRAKKEMKFIAVSPLFHISLPLFFFWGGGVEGIYTNPFFRLLIRSEEERSLTGLLKGRVGTKTERGETFFFLFRKLNNKGRERETERERERAFL